MLNNQRVIYIFNFGVSFNGETYIIAGWFIIEIPKQKWMI
jgi:hypothetical protein